MTSSISFWWVLVLVHSPFWRVFEKNSFPHWSHMSFYMCFDWFKKLRLFVYVLNLKIDVVLKALRAVVIRWFSLNETSLGLFKFISDYLPYFEKINIFFNIIAKLEAQHWAEPVSLTFHSAMRKLNTEPSIGASHQISVHFGKAISEEKIFRNRSIRNNNCLWWPCLLTDRDEMSNLYGGPPIDASYQVSVHLAKWFQRRRFLKIGQSETRIACGGHVC